MRAAVAREQLVARARVVVQPARAGLVIEVRADALRVFEAGVDAIVRCSEPRVKSSGENVTLFVCLWNKWCLKLKSSVTIIYLFRIHLQ